MKTNNFFWFETLQKNTSNLIFLLFFLTLLLKHSYGFAQDDERWFQIEISIFSHQLTSDRDSEFWSPDEPLSYPKPLIELKNLSDILTPSNWITTENNTRVANFIEDYTKNAGKFSLADIDKFNNTTPFRLGSVEKDPFLSLPPSFSNFIETNQALTRSTEYRLLKHLLWRQPMPEKKDATFILVDNNDNSARSEEVGGSISVYFNQNNDRIVVDSDLWLLNLDAPQKEEVWKIPPLPTRNGAVNTLGKNANLVYQLKEQREMRSGEFHYIDHPAFGFVVSITRHIQIKELETPF
jgi:hypothetical protein